MPSTQLAEALDLTGRSILLTGATGGFGRAMADLFHEQGGELVLADLPGAALDDMAAQLGVTTIGYDQGDIRSVERVAQAAGEIDVLINNAGVLLSKPLLETTADEIVRLVSVDLVGVMALTIPVARGMIARGRGTVLTVGVTDRSLRRTEPRRLRGREGRARAVHPDGGGRVGAARRPGGVPRAGPRHHPHVRGNACRSGPSRRGPRAHSHGSVWHS